MLRCYYLAFEGTPRGTGSRPPHEAPVIMTIPLAILAILAVGIGFLGFPPERGPFQEFLAPVFAAAGGAAHHVPGLLGPALAALSLAAVLTGAAFATECYLRDPARPGRLAARYPGLYRTLLAKYYVDEFYDRALVQPISRGSRWLWRRLDEGAIDGCVNGIGETLRGAGQRLRRIQSGYVMNYVLSFLAGIVALLGYLAFRG